MSTGNLQKTAFIRKNEEGKKDMVSVNSELERLGLEEVRHA
jgi:hypothetical protein